jgi:hypothetical protein
VTIVALYMPGWRLDARSFDWALSDQTVVHSQTMAYRSRNVACCRLLHIVPCQAYKYCL